MCEWFALSWEDTSALIVNVGQFLFKSIGNRSIRIGQRQRTNRWQEWMDSWIGASARGNHRRFCKWIVLFHYKVNHCFAYVMARWETFEETRKRKKNIETHYQKSGHVERLKLVDKNTVFKMMWCNHTTNEWATAITITTTENKIVNEHVGTVRKANTQMLYRLPKSKNIWYGFHATLWLGMLHVCCGFNNWLV